MTLELELRVDKPHSRACEVSPVLADGTSQFVRIVNRDAPLADVQAGDTIESLTTRRQNVVVGVTVLEWYGDDA